MDFRTEILPLEGVKGLVNYSKSVVMLGSCFTDNIGSRLKRAIFDCDCNPCGTLYNPASIASALLDILYERPYTASDLFEHDGLWHSFNHHSKFSGTDKEQTLRHINDSLRSAISSLGRASVLIVTFGTAWIYRLKEGNQVVANCHKMPARMFRQTDLSLAETTESLGRTIGIVRTVNPGAKIIFTVSPLRYLADGMHANTLIKSRLHLAIDAVSRSHEGIIYFPAYEIVNDDLRDYRFYADDMKHPSAQAVRYIYDLFSQSFFTPQTAETAAAGRRLSRRLSHRAMAVSETEIKELDLLRQYPQLRNGYKRFIENEL